jgi:hypothetical protein
MREIPARQRRQQFIRDQTLARVILNVGCVCRVVLSRQLADLISVEVWWW